MTAIMRATGTIRGDVVLFECCEFSTHRFPQWTGDDCFNRAFMAESVSGKE
jgi:hypothetical protein